MSDNDPSQSARRGSILIDLGRYAEAERYFREALVHEPTDPWHLSCLAFCELRQERAPAAFETICRALAFAPGDAELHALKARIEIDLHRPDDALASATQALEIDPESDDALTARAAAYFEKNEWAKAEEAARAALEINPDNVYASRQLAYALRYQNRLQESESHSTHLLERAPEDSDNHVTAGWLAFQKGEDQKAEEHFVEALRLQPDNESAQDGLDESFFAKFPIYRHYLKHRFSLQRYMGARQVFIQKWLGAIKWLILTGLGALVGIGRLVLDVIMGILGVVYNFLILWAHVADAISNFFRSFSPTARRSLSRLAIMEACISGGGMAAGLPMLFVGVIAGWPAARIIGGTLVVAAFPFACTFMNTSRGRWLFGAFGALVVLAGALNLSQNLWGRPSAPWITATTAAAGLGAFATLCLCNLRSLNSRALPPSCQPMQPD